MSKTEILFFVSWIVCGSCIEAIFDDRRALVIAVCALIVGVVAGLGIIRNDLLEEGKR